MGGSNSTQQQQQQQLSRHQKSRHGYPDSNPHNSTRHDARNPHALAVPYPGNGLPPPPINDPTQQQIMIKRMQVAPNQPIILNAHAPIARRVSAPARHHADLSRDTRREAMRKLPPQALPPHAAWRRHSSATERQTPEQLYRSGSLLRDQSKVARQARAELEKLHTPDGLGRSETRQAGVVLEEEELE